MLSFSVLVSPTFGFLGKGGTLDVSTPLFKFLLEKPFETETESKAFFFPRKMRVVFGLFFFKGLSNRGPCMPTERHDGALALVLVLLLG